jgi:protein-S-isoprenylcysteine O-methyltransferase Ste14
MDTTRYVLGVMLAVGVPPAVVFWMIIHPLAAYWQRMGTRGTYLVVTPVCVALGVAVYLFRDPILGPDLGTNRALIIPGVILYLVSAWISIQTKRKLPVRTFAGVPEIAKDHSEGTLLQDGVYGVIRHPRYLSVIIGTAGFAMFVNYLGTYLIVLATVPALYLVVIMEERELAQRFGAEYEKYRSRVPAIFPRIGKKTLFPLLALLSLVSPVDAQQGTVLESQSFHSSSLDTEWEYSVYLPPGYESGERSYLTVGDDDSPWRYEGAVDFYTALLEAEMSAELRMTDGPHTWEVWDKALPATLTFFSRVFRARYR